MYISHRFFFSKVLKTISKHFKNKCKKTKRKIVNNFETNRHYRKDCIALFLGNDYGDVGEIRAAHIL